MSACCLETNPSNKPRPLPSFERWVAKSLVRAMGHSHSKKDEAVFPTDIRHASSEVEAQSEKLHLGHRSQMKRICRILQSKLQELSKSGMSADLSECEDLARQMEALLDMQASRGRNMSKEPALPQEVKEWLVNQWTEGSFRLGEELSPIRGTATLRATQSVPFGDELKNLLEMVGTPEIDVVTVQKQPEVAGNVLTVLFVYTLSYGGVFDQLPVQSLSNSSTGEIFQDRLVKFASAIEGAYLDVPYHNNLHAADVTMMMHSFCLSSNMSWISPLEHLVGLIAAVIHDVGHDGVNNLFHVKAQSAVALRYNDKSVLENMHCAFAFELMKEHEDTNWLSLMNTSFTMDPNEKATDLRQYMRRAIIEMVLPTDPTKHNALMDDLKALVQAKSIQGEGGLNDAKQKQAAFSVLLHAADVSNTTRKLPIALYWSKRVLLEFWAQGDHERSLGLEVSPLCDRTSGMASVPQGQIGFINFIVRPLYQQLGLLLPEIQEAVEQLKKTEAYWQEKKEEGANFLESFAILDEWDRVESNSRWWSDSWPVTPFFACGGHRNHHHTFTDTLQ